MRKPIRINKNNYQIVSPCDGMVTYVDDNKLSIFLSPLDVHWQYTPIDSTIKDIQIIHGTHNMANTPESCHNEGVQVIFTSDYGDIYITQRVGFFVRRILNIIHKGYFMKQNDPYGIICFGSRVDIILPTNVTCVLKKKDRVIAGVTSLI